LEPTIKFIREVPRLDALTEDQFFAVLAAHILTCHSHADITEHLPHQAARIHRITERFECSGCGLFQPFNIRHNDTGSLDEYVCALLQQGVKFNRRHAPCVVPQ